MLQDGGVRVVFICIDSIILMICLKLKSPPCHMFPAGLFLVIPPNVLLHIALLKLALAD